MGNQSSPKSSLLTKNWQRISQSIFCNVITEELIQQSLIWFKTQEELEHSVGLYRRRANNNNTNVIKLIYFLTDIHKQTCSLLSQSYKMKVYTEYISLSLEDFIAKNQETKNCFCVSLINGVMYLKEKYGAFGFDESMIFVAKNVSPYSSKLALANRNLTSAKVWINSQVGKCYKQRESSEDEMLNDCKAIFKLINQKHICDKFKSIRFQQCGLNSLKQFRRWILDLHDEKIKHSHSPQILKQEKDQNKVKNALITQNNPKKTSPISSLIEQTPLTDVKNVRSMSALFKPEKFQLTPHTNYKNLPSRICSPNQKTKEEGSSQKKINLKEDHSPATFKKYLVKFIHQQSPDRPNKVSQINFVYSNSRNVSPIKTKNNLSLQVIPDKVVQKTHQKHPTEGSLKKQKINQESQRRNQSSSKSKKLCEELPQKRIRITEEREPQGESNVRYFNQIQQVEPFPNIVVQSCTSKEETTSQNFCESINGEENTKPVQKLNLNSNVVNVVNEQNPLMDSQRLAPIKKQFHQTSFHQTTSRSPGEKQRKAQYAEQKHETNAKLVKNTINVSNENKKEDNNQERQKVLSKNYNKYLARFREITKRIDFKNRKPSETMKPTELDNSKEILNPSKQFRESAEEPGPQKPSSSYNPSDSHSKQAHFGERYSHYGHQSQIQVSNHSHPNMVYLKPPQMDSSYHRMSRKKIQKIQIQKDLQWQKQIIKLQMQVLFKNQSGKEQSIIKERVKNKKATFAELKAEASKILDDFIF